MADLVRRLRICAVGSLQSTNVRGRLMAQSRRGHQVTAITEKPVDSPPLRVLIPPRTSLRLPGLRSFGGILYILRYWRLLRSQPMDLLHVHYGCSLGSWLALASGRRPLVVTAMGGDVLTDEQAPHLSARAVALTRMVFRHADLVTSKSALLTRRLQEWGVSVERILPLMWGVDPETFRRVDAAELRRTLGLADDDRVVLSPRSLSPLYNIDVIVDAFARIHADCSRAVLVLAWAFEDGAYARRLCDRVGHLGLTGSVRWAGSVDSALMPQLYSMAEVMVSIPSSDGMPQCLIETLACETPAVVGQLERYTELVQDGSSALFVPIAAEPVAAAVLRLLNEPGLARRLAQRGREIVVERCDLDTDLARLEEGYAAVLRQPHRRRSLLALKALAMVVAAQIGAQMRDYAGRAAEAIRRGD